MLIFLTIRSLACCRTCPRGSPRHLERALSHSSLQWDLYRRSPSVNGAVPRALAFQCKSLAATCHLCIQETQWFFRLRPLLRLDCRWCLCISANTMLMRKSHYRGQINTSPRGYGSHWLSEQGVWEVNTLRRFFHCLLFHEKLRKECPQASQYRQQLQV